ncbi:MAG: DNA polymerase III subunit alpha [Planctomycetes bacterium]|nr:DNA polymerase III subunit alpha [Planctomycetota bacterium]
MRSKFVHLHVHSDYSLLDGAAPIENLLDAAKKQGMDALALTDHGNLFGGIEFYRHAIAKGIKPILGCEAYIAPRSRTERAGNAGNSNHHITLLVRNDAGYRNLVKLVTESYLTGFYYRPRIDKDLLAAHGEGLIGLSGCLKSEVNGHLTRGAIQEALGAIDSYRQILGKENFYLEVMDHGIDQQRTNGRQLVEAAKKVGARIVGTNDVHYVSRDFAPAHDIFMCIGTGKRVHETDRLRYPKPEFYLKSSEEMCDVFRDLPEAAKATLEIAERCHLELDFSRRHLPAFPTPDGIPPRTFLRTLCAEGMARRFGEAPPPAYLARLDHELRMIEQMDFVSYFLIVRDLIQYAKRSGIPVGPGRGSSASSLVAYVLEITDVDPLLYDLIFERFLQPGRANLPDIDIDFCQEGRARVIEYVRQKYGADCVAQIITFGRLAARAAIRDVGRVLDLPLPLVDTLAKKIPARPGITLAEALKGDKDLQETSQQDEQVRHLFTTAQKLEGLCRHASTHAAGVVIGDRPLTELVPLYRNGDDVTTQYEMEHLEAIGLLKIDFLGLRTLTVLDTAAKFVQERTGARPDLDRLPLDDPETYALLARGEGKGVFQCESRGMRELLQNLKPDTFGDIIALLALYRPGPLEAGMVEEFVRRKHGQSKVAVPHPTLEPILRGTYGVIVYQEQVMRIANILAGFSMEEADALRKAMGKKVPEIIANLRERFLQGARKEGVPPKTAEEVFGLIAYFGGYGFNKAHSTAYALLTYRTAYLKAHHPTEYMAALMTWDRGNTDKIASAMQECRRMGIQVEPPDVNESSEAFTVVGEGRIRFGLGAVKGVGSRAVQSVEQGRAVVGRFRSLAQFCEHVDLRLVNRAVGESLIKCGAFDSLGVNRSTLLAGLDGALDLGSSTQADRAVGQGALFGDPAQEGGAGTSLPDWPDAQKLAYEKKVLGFYVTSHPLAEVEPLLDQFSSANTSELADLEDGQPILLGGMVAKVKTTLTKRGKNPGEKMAQFTMEDLHGSVGCVIFPKDYERFRSLLVPERVVFAQGKLDLRREEPSLRVSGLVPVERAAEMLTGKVRLRVPEGEEDILYRLRELLRTHPGTCPVVLEFADPSAKGAPAQVRVGSAFFISPSEKFLREVRGLLGESGLVLERDTRAEVLS